MILNTGKIKYEVIREVSKGEINDVLICRNVLDRTAPCKTIWVVKKRDIAKSLIKGFAGSDEGVCEEYFSLKDNMCFVFPYAQERPLFRFYMGNIREDGCSRQQIWLDIITQCMTKKLPNGMLNLILSQRRINIAADGSIDFDYLVDLTNYQEDIGEKDNVTLCAKMILELIYLDEGKGGDTTVYLLEKKLKRSKYGEFIQLFKDIKIIMQDDSEIGRLEKAKLFLRARQDMFYRILCVVCVILVCVVVFELVGNVMFKNFSLAKLFATPLEQIGTQSLLD